MEIEGNTFMPEWLAYLPNTLEFKLQVESKLAQPDFVCVCFPPFPPAFISQNLVFYGWQTTKTRDGPIPFGNSVEAEAITIQLLQPAPGQHPQRKGFVTELES
jgi:hypothetical protein